MKVYRIYRYQRTWPWCCDTNRKEYLSAGLTDFDWDKCAPNALHFADRRSAWWAMTALQPTFSSREVFMETCEIDKKTRHDR